MSKTRDEFLQLHWTRYPQMPPVSVQRGRIGDAHLKLDSLHSAVMFNQPLFKAPDVLAEGDLVAILPDKTVLLLAPNLRPEKKSGEWESLQKWPEFLQLIRQFFKDKSFQEVKTPTLVKCPGTEPSLDIFETEFRQESKSQIFYLPTSPELNLKKLLAEGAEQIFEIAPVFRNGEITLRHRPEFLMLEWYRAFSNLNQIKVDSQELIRYLAAALQVEPPAEVLSFSVAGLFKEHLHFDLTPLTSEKDLKELALREGVDVSAATCIDDYFYLLFMDKIEFRWPHEALVFVEKYPPYQAALARLDEQGWAERFEIYWRGFELANAFHELNDPVAQRLRATEDLEKKKQMNKKPLPLDEKFFEALEFGMPPSGGIALGLERLYMVFYGISDISRINRIY